MALTREEIVEKVEKYFSSAKAEKSSFGDHYCFYRDKDGRKCVVGCLIPDELYDPSIEGNAIHVFFDEPVDESKRKIRDFLGVENKDFLDRLQQIHDDVANNLYFCEERYHFGESFLDECRWHFTGVFK